MTTFEYTWREVPEEAPERLLSLGYYALEILFQGDGQFRATAWHHVPAGMLEPEEFECMYEEVFEDLDDAIAAVEVFDRRLIALERMHERLLEQPEDDELEADLF
jgi:hypothetical protein